MNRICQPNRQIGCPDEICYLVSLYLPTLNSLLQFLPLTCALRFRRGSVSVGWSAFPSILFLYSFPALAGQGLSLYLGTLSYGATAVS